MKAKDIVKTYEVVRSHNSSWIHLYKKDGTGAVGHISGKDLIMFHSDPEQDINITSDEEYKKIGLENHE